MLRRTAATIIDYLLGVIPLTIICNIMLGNVVGNNVNPQILPIVSFQLVLSPIGIIMHVIEYPYSLGINLEQLYFSLLITFIIEVIFYSMFDLSPMKRTVGKVLMHLEYEHNLTLRYALLRNAVKTLTRYILGIPLIYVLFSNKGNTLHDVMIHNSVIRS